MFNPPNFNLVKLITHLVQQEKVDNRILELVQQVLEKELDRQNLVLSRPEKSRLFRQVTKAVLSDMLTKIDSDK